MEKLFVRDPAVRQAIIGNIEIFVNAFPEQTDNLQKFKVNPGCKCSAAIFNAFQQKQDVFSKTLNMAMGKEVEVSWAPQGMHPGMIPTSPLNIIEVKDADMLKAQLLKISGEKRQVRILNIVAIPTGYLIVWA